MTTAALRKEERINLRATHNIKRMIAMAAELSHVSVTDFVLSTAITAAQRVIAESETIVLSNEERDRFMNLLDNPPPPNAALKAAMQEHREHLSL